MTEGQNIDETRKLLSQLNAYATEHNLTNRLLAEKLHVPYHTLSKWWFFTQSKDARNPSELHINRIREFLELIESPGIYKQREEARRRTQKVKYLLLLLEDELRWFRDNDSGARELFRKALNASDIGYISSLLSMLTEEDRFNRWLNLTTTRFQSFKER